MWRTSARVSTPVIAGDAAVGEPVEPAALGGGGVLAVLGLAHDHGAGVDAVGLHRLGADAVVADERIGEGDDLARVGGVGDRLLVAGHRGVEDDLAGASLDPRARAAELAVEARAVLEQDVAGLAARSRRVLQDEPLDRLELVAAGRAEQLEERGLDARQPGAGPLGLGEAELAVGGAARADRVGDDVDLDAAVEQVEDGLVDADVRLDPADDRLVAAAEVEAVGLGRREDGLLESARCPRAGARRPRERSRRGPSGTAR